jgi:predicted AlkP superfamily pyrophosphatase or phosphodiesterase
MMKATPSHSSSARAHAPRGAAPILGLLLALLVVLAPLGAGARQRRDATPRATAAAESRTRARLVLVVVVDQFRYEYLERFGDLFAEGGLRRLQREGASWSNANYDHIPTETAPGHSTLLTGAWPAETGIIANDWYDRARGRRVNNVEDESARLIGGGEKERAASPRAMLASTLGDELKLATAGRSKVFGLSVKDRGAILPAGRMADGAFWYSPATGQFVTSNYYADRLPAWVARFNEAKRADKYFGAKWERLLPAAEYERRAGRDDAPWEKGDGRFGFTFPHTIGGGAARPGPEFYNALLYSPYTNDMLVRLAEEAVVNERLGADADTDVLSVGFSANDYVGHRFGPYSHETMDVNVRTDRQVEQLLKMVDARVGLRHTLVVFTSDHGVAPVPEHAAEMRLPGGRVKPSEMLNVVKERIRARYGKGEGRDNTADYVLIYSNGQLYFNQQALERDGVRPEEIERVAGEAALTVPGVARYFTRTQLLTRAVSPGDAVARRALHGYNPARSGDVVIIAEPYKYLNEYAGASHGAPYSYDTHVPVIIMGAGVAAGLYAQEATPADIAPTLARLLRVQPPSNSVGRVLIEALR